MDNSWLAGSAGGAETGGDPEPTVRPGPPELKLSFSREVEAPTDGPVDEAPPTSRFDIPARPDAFFARDGRNVDDADLSSSFWQWDGRDKPERTRFGGRRRKAAGAARSSDGETAGRARGIDTPLLPPGWADQESPWNPAPTGSVRVDGPDRFDHLDRGGDGPSPTATVPVVGPRRQLPGPFSPSSRARRNGALAAAFVLVVALAGVAVVTHRPDEVETAADTVTTAGSATDTTADGANAGARGGSPSTPDDGGLGGIGSSDADTSTTPDTRDFTAAAPTDGSDDDGSDTTRAPSSSSTAGGASTSAEATTSTTAAATSTTEQATTTTSSSLDPTTSTTAGCFVPTLSESFDGSAVDTSVWQLYAGTGRGGNGRFDPAAVTVADGVLAITARMVDGEVVSGGLRQVRDQTYGRYEVTIRAGTDPGVSAVAAAWPSSDAGDAEGNTILYGTAGSASFSSTVVRPGGTREAVPHGVAAADWHTVAVEWTPESVKVFRDGALVQTVAGPVAGTPEVLALQLDALDASVVGPVTMEVDAVTVSAYRTTGC